MRKGKPSRLLKNAEIYEDLYGKPFKCDWVPRAVFL